MGSVEEPKKVTGGAFGRFLAEKRAEFTKECSGKPVTAVVKLASERFKALDEDARKAYETKYKEAVAQYTKDMEAFLAAGGQKKAIKRKSDGDDDDKASKKAKKDANAPKKPAGGAYGCYLAKHREAFTKECEGQSITAVAKLAGQRWKEVSEAEKKVFEEEFAAKMAKYKEEMQSYVPPEKPAEAETEKTPEKKKSGKAKTPVKKKEAKASKTPASPAEKKVTKASKGQAPKGPVLESAVAAEAEKKGLTGTLLQLLKRQDVIDSGKTQGEVLKAVVGSGGLLHPARRALLGA